MKIIAYSKSNDEYVEKILPDSPCPDPAVICIYSEAEDFMEAVRANTEPKPVILFDAAEQYALNSLIAIKKYITDAVLFLIVPDEPTYRKARMEFSLYLRYILYRDDDPHILSAMLLKLMARSNRHR